MLAAARRGAFGVVAASWTIGSEEDGPALYLANGRMGHLDKRASGERPGVRPGGASQGQSPGR